MRVIKTHNRLGLLEPNPIKEKKRVILVFGLTFLVAVQIGNCHKINKKIKAKVNQ